MLTWTESLSIFCEYNNWRLQSTEDGELLEEISDHQLIRN